MSECKRCSTELTKDNDRDCFYCSLCHPPQKKSLPTEELEKNYIDVKPTEKRTAEIIKIIKDIVPDIVIDILEDWYIKRPAKGIVETQNIVDKNVIEDKPIVDGNVLDKHTNWRSEAKELNIELYDKKNNKPRKKVDVITDIEKKKLSL